MTLFSNLLNTTTYMTYYVVLVVTTQLHIGPLASIIGSKLYEQ
jgi:hypothetical protein